jgi:microcystin-dependent protein
MEPFIGQIMMVPYTFAPQGWAFCNGQLLPISSNTALFSLVGTTYGGDGRTNFALPDLRGRVPMHAGNGPGLSPRRLGESGGSESETMSTAQMPAHNHPIQITEAKLEAYEGGRGEQPNAGTPGGNLLGNPSDFIYYQGKSPNASLADSALTVEAQSGNTGGSQPVSKMQPFTTVHFVIALQGIYPTRG